MAEAPSSQSNGVVQPPPPGGEGESSTPQEPYSVVMTPYTTPECYTHLKTFQVCSADTDIFNNSILKAVFIRSSSLTISVSTWLRTAPRAVCS